MRGSGAWIIWTTPGVGRGAHDDGAAGINLIDAAAEPGAQGDADNVRRNIGDTHKRGAAAGAGRRVAGRDGGASIPDWPPPGEGAG